MDRVSSYHSLTEKHHNRLQRQFQGQKKLLQTEWTGAVLHYSDKLWARLEKHI